jgi:hypothetical protein
MENNLPVILALGGIALTAVLGIVWQFRVIKGRRLQAALDAYAAREIARLKTATDAFALREIAREKLWKKRKKARVVGGGVLQSR